MAVSPFHIWCLSVNGESHLSSFKADVGFEPEEYWLYFEILDSFPNAVIGIEALLMDSYYLHSRERILFIIF
jgi:hypothetical protein